MTSWKDLKETLLADPDVAEAHTDLAPEYALARQLIAARAAAGLSQAQVAERMGTKASEVSRIEAGRQNVSMNKLRKYAKAVGKEVDLRLI